MSKALINLRQLLESRPVLKGIFKILEDGNIRYGIFAGACVSILTSNRKPTDVDFLVADEDFNKLGSLFRGSVKEINDLKTRGKFYYLKRNRDIEFVSELDFKVGKKVFPIRLTSLAWQNVLKYNVLGDNIILLNPVDTLLEKAISPRGSEVGKHDLEDIDALFKLAEIDREYLKKRVKEMKAEEQVSEVLQKYNYSR